MSWDYACVNVFTYMYVYMYMDEKVALHDKQKHFHFISQANKISNNKLNIKILKKC